MNPNLKGKAEQLIVIMQSDNGCRFKVTDDQAIHLTRLCNATDLDQYEMDILAMGEENEIQELLNKQPLNYIGIHYLLADIFNGELE